MVIFLYGPDDYRRTQKKREFAAEFSKKRSAQGVGAFDLALPDGLAELEAFLTNQPLFESAKLAVLENAFAADAAKLAKIIVPYLEHKTTTVLISEPDKPVKTLAFLLKKPALFQEFKKLSGELAVRFAHALAERSGVALDAAAAKHLAEVFAGDSWGLATEIEKLASFAPKITARELDRFDLEAAPAYWPLIMGVRHAELRKRLAALETLFMIGDPAPKIFNILAAQWRERTRDMAEYDVAVKSGKLEYDEALLALVLS